MTSHSIAANGLYAGTSGWAYASWKPDFYPKSVSAKNFLAYYATQLNSVEVNYTFRALPTATMLHNWLHATEHRSFRFSFKAPQTLTHVRRLKEAEKPLTAFLAALEPVREANRLGCLLFQLPPNFQANPERLADFLALTPLQNKYSLAWEFRHASWFTEETYAILRAHNAAVCIAESDTLTAPESFTASFSYYRLRMEGGYQPAAVHSLAQKFSALSSQRPTYVYFKHEEEPTGPLAATRMLQEGNAL